MLSAEEAKEILRSLAALPAEKVKEVRDFVSFLNVRYGRGTLIDQSDSWTEEDLRDLTTSVLRRAESTVWDGGSQDAQPR